jgi:XTP/dITP diphosphohydrolase
LFEGTGVALCSLYDYDGVPEILEDGASFFDNALKKAKAVSEWTGETALADDSGLEVDALEGAPGIYSARYAGLGASDAANIEKLLRDLDGVPPERRSCAFRCVLVLYESDGRFSKFEGSWHGRIAEKASGTSGFGYDPVFIVPELSKTAAELTPEVKNQLSHRALAFRRLKEYLKGIYRAGAGDPKRVRSTVGA